MHAFIIWPGPVSIDHYGYDYALYLAERGNVAVAFDPRGFGESRERNEWGETRP